MSGSPKRAQRINTPFSKDQQTWLVLEFGKVRNISTLRRKFRLHFGIAPRNVPNYSAFARLIERFTVSKGQVRPQVPAGNHPPKQDVVQQVKELLECHQENQTPISLRSAAQRLNLSATTVWRVARRQLKWFPYKPHITVQLTDRHKSDRVKFSKWLLEQPEDFVDRVIWTDEKWFSLHQSPNKQNERYWAPYNPHVLVDCRIQGDKKVMCWAAIVGGKVMLHWFDRESSVNGEAYLNVLKEVLWPAIRRSATARQFWFQQDGATIHTTQAARTWLSSKFGRRVISRLTDRPWPARSPDLTPVDFWFWSVALAELRRVPPRTLEELKATVQEFADSMDCGEVLGAVRHIRARAKKCLQLKGAVVEPFS